MKKITICLFSAALFLSSMSISAHAASANDNFSAYDINGKKVSLSDFKGKVVFVDVWATWCGPCKQEIPFLKQLEEEYHGKDIVFVSVSIDNAKDKQKWADFVKDQSLTGVQLFGGEGPNSEIVKMYGIKSIPRFLLYNKKGETGP